MFKKFFATREQPYFPGFDKPETIEFDISGNHLSFKFPKHGDVTDEINKGPNINLYNMPPSVDERGITSMNRHQSGSPAVNVLFRRGYTMHEGGFRTPNIGFLQASVYLLHVKQMPNDMSCFNPQHAEQAAQRIAYFHFGPGHAAQRKYMGMTDWQIKKINGLVWQNFFSAVDIREHSIGLSEEELIRGKDFTEVYTLPIDDHYMLEFSFKCNGYWPEDACHREVHKVTQRLMETVTLNYSPAIQGKILNAQAQWPNAKHSGSLPREEWQYHNFRDLTQAEKDEGLHLKTPHVIELTGTLPPVFKSET